MACVAIPMKLAPREIAIVAMQTGYYPATAKKCCFAKNIAKMCPGNIFGAR